MATVQDALKIARTMLNDDMGVNYSDGILMPKIAQAHAEMIAKLALNGIPVTREESAVIQVNAAVAPSLTLPTDFIDPITLFEMDRGAASDTAIEMTKQVYLPLVERTTTLRYWAWREQEVKFIGATTNRDVILRYIKGFTAPTKVTETLVFSQSEIYLGPRAAALTMLPKSKSAYDEANTVATENLSVLVRAQVKRDQLPVRRRPFSVRRPNRRW